MRLAAKHIEELLRCKIGLHVESIGESTFERVVGERMAACGAFGEDAYLGHLQKHPGELERLIEQVVVHESWFFREPASLELLCARATAAARTPARPFRVLSLPCASGEEPYSVAIMLLLAGLLPGTFEITGIDVSASALEAARRGVYSEYAFRGGLDKLDGYVDARISGMQVSGEVRKLVNFAQGNVLDPLLLPGAQFDAVLCRNLLIYLDTDARGVALRTILRVLAEDGVLFTGHAESSIALDHGLRKVGDARSFAFERGKRRSVRPGPPLAKGPAPAAPSARRRVAGAAPSRRAAISARKSTRPAPPARPRLEDARTLADRGDLDGARRQCEAYLAACGPDPAAYCLLAVVKEAGGDIDGAVDAFGRALYLDAEQLDALLHLALLHERRGEAQTARSMRKRAERVQRRRNA
jgi:chemotaxis protein methyltransferase WspC